MPVNVVEFRVWAEVAMDQAALGATGVGPAWFRSRAAQPRWTSKPRLTPGRAINAVNQRRTCGKSSKFTRCRSCRQAQPRMAKSATESAPATYSTPASRRSSTP